jgi:hypothetical protein
MNILEQLVKPDVIWILIPLAGIALGGIISVGAMIIKHRERMAKIGMGIDPDAQANTCKPQEKQFNDSTPRF